VVQLLRNRRSQVSVDPAALAALERLNQLREKIDGVDAALLRLLNERASIVLEVQRVKASADLPRVDGPRMDQILERLVALNPGPLTADEVRDLHGQLLRFFAYRLQPR
jgi:chorismate mutase / prephenate dehydratase